MSFNNLDTDLICTNFRIILEIRYININLLIIYRLLKSKILYKSYTKILYKWMAWESNKNTNVFFKYFIFSTFLVNQ